MSFEIAKSAITKHIMNSDGFDEVEIDLFGGEPFLRPAFIQALCEWTWKQRFPKPIIFFIDTNGTRVHGNIQTWLQQNKDSVCLSLSLDGTPATHNRNRSNSYSSIDIDFFLKTYPDQPVRMTISPATLPNLSNDIIHIHKLGFKLIAAMAQGVEWNIEENKKQFALELETLCNFYLNNKSISPCSLFDMCLPMVVNNEEQVKWCGCGTSMVTIDFNGKEYPCQLFLPSSMTDDIEWEYLDLSDYQNLSDEECSSCLIRNICPTCYGINLIRDRNIKKRDKNLCELYKVLALANSYLKGLFLDKNILTIHDPKELHDTILAIQQIQSDITN